MMDEPTRLKPVTFIDTPSCHPDVIMVMLCILRVAWGVSLRHSKESLLEKLQRLDSAAEAVSDSDLVGKLIMGDGNWGLLPLQVRDKTLAPRTQPGAWDFSLCV
jgi:hypothetical protein